MQLERSKKITFWGHICVWQGEFSRLQDFVASCSRGFNFIYSGLKYISIEVFCQQLLTVASGLL